MEIDDLRARVEALRRDYAALSLDGWGEPGPPDEQTGERWDRGHVLGHVAEMLPYWTEQIRGVLAGGDAVGRDEAGSARRRAGIERGREAGEAGLLAQIDTGLAGVLELLAGMRDADLDRGVLRRLPGAEEEATLGEQLDVLMIGHAEAHLRQVQELGT
jgi:hypothetical protein